MDEISRSSFQGGGGERRRLETPVSGGGGYHYYNNENNNYDTHMTTPGSPPVHPSLARSGEASNQWGFCRDPEMKRRKRIASYKVYTVEGRISKTRGRSVSAHGITTGGRRRRRKNHFFRSLGGERPPEILPFLAAGAGAACIPLAFSNSRWCSVWRLIFFLRGVAGA
ncbi:hypothetical protein BUALT_Bualt13G0002200 [Buddleja alternifolia]|uniref:Uncharacterized protein n=1 Tax=Buddleja alternifolia TaxID=168488 RepID=A0AAV6WIP6_9LAMI|nr:hypothetical protein BUALT_Bualt13G0002200 [Buddleja alternifolia]